MGGSSVNVLEIQEDEGRIPEADRLKVLSALSTSIVAK